MWGMRVFENCASAEESFVDDIDLRYGLKNHTVYLLTGFQFRFDLSVTHSW